MAKANVSKKIATVNLPAPRNHVLMCLIEAVQGQAPQKDGYESGDDDELVLRGMKVLGSSSGTYVVREKAGLKVYASSTPIHPTEEEGTIVTTLQYGQTVQINLYETKIATVARGGGYILVNDSSQLVKGKSTGFIFINLFLRDFLLTIYCSRCYL
jgi:hypothetical protein